MSKPSKNHTQTCGIPKELLPELAGMIDSVGDGIAVVVEGGRYVYVSEGAARMTGYSVDELFEMGLNNLIHPDERANIREAVTDTLNRSVNHARYETAILHKDGSKIWFEITNRRILWEGKPASMVLLKDLTPGMQAAAELKQQETRFRDLLEMMGEGMGVYDENGVVLYANTRLAAMLQYDREKMIGRNILAVFEEEFREKIKEKMAQRRTGIQESYECNMVRKDGVKLPVRITSAPRIGKDGLYRGSVAVVTDMTAVKRAERAKMEHTRKIETLNRIMVCGNRAKDTVTYLEDIVDATLNLMRFVGGAVYLVDKDAGVARLVVHGGETAPANREELLEIRVGSEPYGSVYVDGKPIIRKIPAKRGKGEIIFFLVIAMPIVSGETIIGSLNLGTTAEHTFLPDEIDTLKAIGEEVGAAILRIRSEAALRESEVGFRAVIENANDGISIISEDGLLVFLNDRACEIVGYKHKELIGTRFMDLLHEECRQNLIEVFHERIGGESPPISLEVTAMHKSGYRVFGEVSMSNVFWRSRPASLAIIRDISERKRREKVDHQYAEELEAEVARRTETLRVIERQHAEAERQASVGRMAARIAHEINNPLAGVKNSLRLIRDALPKTHQYYDYIGLIDSEIDRMAAIVRQMYVIHKPEAATIRKINVASVVNEVVDLLRPGFEKRRVVARADSGDPHLTATLAEGSFRQILFNLIQNAVEASPPGGVVDIETKREEERLILEIRDRGPGIPEEIRDKIYEPFFTTKEEMTEGGLGLGLPNTLSLVKGSLQGEISFTSEADGGTLFRVSIPLEADKNAGGRE